MPLRLDSHQHFWAYRPSEFEWIEDSMSAIRRDFLPEDLAPLLRAEGIDGSVAVQARQTSEETAFLLHIAEQFPETVRAVVGWAPIASPEFPGILEQLCAVPPLRGLRHVVQAEGKGFLLGPEFARGIRLLRGTGLVYDVLIRSGQLEEATEFVDAHPDQSFVLDHVAKPPIRHRVMEPWATQMRELARRPNVVCKLSGMVTEADWKDWTADRLRPYFEAVLDAFGPRRLMAASDWPVLTLASSYGRWWETLRGWTAPLSADERGEILGGTASRIYGIGEPG